MTLRRRYVLLATTAIVAAAVLAAFLVSAHRLAGDSAPRDLAGLSRWMHDHPADWRAASALAELALDSDVPRRVELWRNAYEHGRRLAPGRANVTIAFVKGGLSHWYELGPADRQAVLNAAGPLLRDSRIFASMYRPLWELTRDFSYLRRHAPDSERDLVRLRDLAAMHGLFGDYRELRGTLVRKRLEVFRAKRSALSPPDLVALLPAHLTMDDEPLVRGVLEELERRPLDAGNAERARARADELVRFAVAHGLRPLGGLDALVETPAIRASTRARLAVALGRADLASSIELTAGASATADWVPYYLERSEFEQRRGDLAMAALYGRRAAVAGFDAETPAELRWNGTCGKNEVCNSVTARVPVTHRGEAIEIVLQRTQSDGVPPYVEVFVGDERVAEGAVADAQRFRLVVPQGRASRIEVRLVNPVTGGRTQRRVRLSRSTDATDAPAIAARVVAFAGMKKLKSISA